LEIPLNRKHENRCPFVDSGGEYTTVNWIKSIERNESKSFAATAKTMGASSGESCGAENIDEMGDEYLSRRYQ